MSLSRYVGACFRSLRGRRHRPPFLSTSSGSLSSEERLNRCVSALRDVTHPKSREDLILSGLLRNITVSPCGRAVVYLEPDLQFRVLRRSVEEALGSLSFLNEVEVSFGSAPSAKPETDSALASTTHIIAVSSCKGGVGKSTIAVNLAYSLSALGLSVSLFDADIYGPSLPTLWRAMDKHSYLLGKDKTKSQAALSSAGTPEVFQDAEGRVLPVMFAGVKLMSYGFVSAKRDSPNAFRGPMAAGLALKLLKGTRWARTDYLIVDLPPGTGDVNLSLLQALSMRGNITVTLPNELSFADVVKGIQLMSKMNVPTLAVVQNMAYFKCGKCSEKHDVFGASQHSRIRNECKVERVIDVPMQPEIASMQIPFALDLRPDSAELREKFDELARVVDSECTDLAAQQQKQPELEYSTERGHLLFKDSCADTIVAPIDPMRLRSMCRCALCESLPPETSSNIAANVIPRRIRRLGNYAFSVLWSDGHSTSIYSFDTLRRLANHPEPSSDAVPETPELPL